MKYENFTKRSKSEIVSLLSSKDDNQIIEGLISIIDLNENWKWKQDQILRFIHHHNFWIAKNAITGLGDLARIHGTLEKLKVTNELTLINNPELKGIIDATVDDFNIFLSKGVPPQKPTD
ncbi:hypothetical protein [Aureispira sp. CCB-QB1]|uniref:hypothetical protein n=1 Tax=Aureispira sp. CCB-QB1 TaxID=1313421 RepID=UPI000696C5B8|nr:hypothetical protein [Aureispira sp. CCB-QB1]